MRIVGYADRFSVQAGQTIRFMVSAEIAQYDASIVRLIQGDDRPEGPGYKEELIESEASGTYPGRHQAIQTGSYIVVPGFPSVAQADGVAVTAWIRPTDPHRGNQGIVTSWAQQRAPGWALVIGEEGHLAFWIRGGDGRSEVVQTELKLRPNFWHFVGCSYDNRSGETHLVQSVVAPGWKIGARDADATRSLPAHLLSQTDLPLLIAAFHDATDREKRHITGHFDGRIEAPRVFARALSVAELRIVRNREADPGGLVARWDFSRGLSTSRAEDTSGNAFHGELINTPMRAVAGSNWTGEHSVYKLAPEQYGAIHFHRDDLEDAGWESDFRLTVPEAWKSGVYAARLRGDGEEEYIPFFVRPQSGSASAPTAFLAPTFSYMAYANEHYYNFRAQDWSRTSDKPLNLGPHNRYIAEHPEVGLSTYDLHADGSGTACYSSRLRPIVNMRPKQIQYWNRAGRHFGADLYLISWLEKFGHAYDVITDEDLHHEGAALLRRYRVVILGHHHEYWSWNMRRALAEFVDTGGRVMNLGGNQMWWVTGVHAEKPHLIEIRKEDMTQYEPLWGTSPAERYLSTTGECGGTWRLRGLDPAQLLATTFAAEGWDHATYFMRQTSSKDKNVSFIFKGVKFDERIGDFGLAMGGAAGDEYDRVYFNLGAPPNTQILASSVGHSARDTKSGFAYQPEADERERVRTDIAYYENEAGGAVFSAASMCWTPALPWNDYSNNVSMITSNVLSEFLTR